MCPKDRVENLPGEASAKGPKPTFKKKLFLVGGVIGGLLAVIFSGAWISSRLNRSVPVSRRFKANPQKQNASRTVFHAKRAALLVPFSGDSFKLTDEIALENKGVHYTLKTTVNPKLQTYVNNLLERSKTLQAAVVVLNPYDGRVLVMSGHDNSGADTNICLKAEYPAASLFKIVSAAAALEAAGYTPKKTLYFNGSRHTLYKNQLKQQQGRYTSETQLRKAFAVSNNSIFGKLGIMFSVHRSSLNMQKNSISIDRYLSTCRSKSVRPKYPQMNTDWPEIASGFNKRTVFLLCMPPCWRALSSTR